MIIIGSAALKGTVLERPCQDLDVVCSSPEEMEKFFGVSNPGHHLIQNRHVELVVEHLPGAKTREDGLHADFDTLFTLKATHRFKKNSVHFEKTRRDYLALREVGAKIILELYQARDRNYKKSWKLNVSKENFFLDEYRFVHDDIHQAMARGNKPAYTFFQDGEVWCSKEKFFQVSEEIQIYAVVEEATVLALERSQVPYPKNDPKKSWIVSLQKVCTTLSSGWFREFAWNHYDVVKALYDPNYVDYFWEQVKNGKVRETKKK